ncbi:hypothetical protein LCGC14_0956230 [marine sediment metagenome]|uniref:Uncharacterized protein n=1 Tax=marine sediment metagenome TaxID=412755 RepID=A0A0F9P209_9ZZZZ
MQKCIQLFIRVNFIIIVTDKNDVIYILSKLDVLSKNIINISNEFKMEVIKLKTYFSIPDSTLDKKPWESIPEKFFHDFLKPLLEKKKKMTKKERGFTMITKEFETVYALGELSKEVCTELAEDPHTEAVILTKLFQDKDVNIRCGVASNSNTPQETLTILSTDESWGIKCEVAMNPNTLVEVLTILSTDESLGIKCEVAIKVLAKKL